MTPDLPQLTALLERLHGPVQWGYMCLADGGFIADDAPVEVAVALPALIAELTAARERLAGEAEQYRHIKRGTVYTMIGTAELQAAQPQCEHAALAIYRGEDGKLWARNTAEFHDGRFVAVNHETPPMTEAPKVEQVDRRAIARLINPRFDKLCANADDSAGAGTQEMVLAIVDRVLSALTEPERTAKAVVEAVETLIYISETSDDAHAAQKATDSLRRIAAILDEGAGG